MDIEYLLQILLLILFFIGLHCVSIHRRSKQYELFQIILKENCSFIYNSFSKHIAKKNICAFDKYQIWRYIQHWKVLPLSN